MRQTFTQCNDYLTTKDYDNRRSTCTYCRETNTKPSTLTYLRYKYEQWARKQRSRNSDMGKIPP